MAASIIARSVTVSFGPRPVLDSVDLTLAPGDRIGVVGPNGVGKSTLLGTLAGLVAPDAGRVDTLPAAAVVGLLTQEPSRSPTETVREVVARRTGVLAAQLELDAAAGALAGGEAGSEDRYDAALERWLALGAADLDVRLQSTAADVGLVGRVLDQPTASLSGGEAARTALATMLLSRFDAVLLDEPTNDLDLEGLERLEAWVTALDAPVAVISHDRAFLEAVVTDVVEIDPFDHRLRRFGGGWAAFVEERERARRHARERFEEYESQRRRLAVRAQREREWAASGRARVRRADEPDRNIRAFRIEQTERLAGRAARTERAIERLDEVDEPRDSWQLRLDIPDARRSGDLVAACHGVRVRRGSFELGPIDVSVGYGDRIAVTGPNGSGKSTLIGLLTGRLDADAGTVVRGSSVVVGEIEQTRRRFVGERDLVDEISVVTGDPPGDVRTLLAKFDLGADDVLRPTRTLSPGERTRASLALLMRLGANLLVLDEPTNHLDLEAVEQLEAALGRFGGTVLCVTHDRTLLERVTFGRRWELCGGRFREP